MDTSDTEQERYPGDCLFSESPSRLLVVGELPAVLLDQALAGVEVLRLTSLGDAEAMGVQLDTQARQDASVPASLVLQLNADSSGLQQRLGRAVRAFPHRVLVHFQVSEVSAALLMMFFLRWDFAD